MVTASPYLTLLASVGVGLHHRAVAWLGDHEVATGRRPGRIRHFWPRPGRLGQRPDGNVRAHAIATVQRGVVEEQA
jgi:hypothetical protein